MTLASFHALGRIKAARTAAFRGLHALAVNDTGRWRELTSHRRTAASHQDAIDATPGAIIAPTIKVTLNSRARRKVLRQCSPLTPRRQNVQDCVHHRSQVGLARPSQQSCRRQQRFHQCPLRIRHATCVVQAIASILCPGGFSPSHRDLHQIPQIRRNHKGLKSLNSFFARLWVRAERASKDAAAATSG